MLTPCASRRVWGPALLAFALFAAAVQIVWTRACRARPDPGRNPFLKRGWYDYVRNTPPRDAGEALFVVIGNSQGYGIEVASTNAYPAVLQRMLREEGRRCRVANWSVHGGQYADLITLAAAARDKDPTAIIVVVTPAFQRQPAPGGEARARWSSDVYYLLSHESIRSRMPPDILATMTDLSLRFDFTLARLWAGWRIRNLPTAYLAERKALTPYFPEHGNLSWIISRRRMPPPPPDPAEHSSRPPDRRRAAAFLGVATNASPSVFFVSMPVHSKRETLRVEDWPWIEQLCREHGVRPLDFRRALPNSCFTSPAHLRAAGHREMAARLREVLP